MIQKLIILLVLMTVWCSGSYAQNLCDTKCYGKEKFLIQDTSVLSWSVSKLWEVDSVAITCTPFVIDLIGNDNIPEIVISKFATNEYLSNGLFVIDSQNKTIIKKINTFLLQCG